MANFTLYHPEKSPRFMLHDALGLTGCEVSLNDTPGFTEAPYVHHHEENEELYIILSGSGQLYADGEIVPLVEGDCFRISPACHRSLKAGPAGMRFICIQTREGSLRKFTFGDGVIDQDEKVSW